MSQTHVSSAFDQFRLLDSIATAVLAVDRDYRYLSLNRALIDLMEVPFGTYPEVGASYFEHLPNAHDRELLRADID